MSFLQLGKDNWARTRPTREGIMFLGLTLFVGFAALNTGNNLIYLTFGMMLSFIIVSGIISMVNLSRIEVSLHHPSDVFALTPKPFRFSLANKKPLLPSYSLTIELGGKRAYVPYLPADFRETVGVQCFFKERGWNSLPEAVLYTKFPFGFFKKWIRVDIGIEQVLVFPKVQRVESPEGEFREKYGESESESLGFGDDLRSIRQYSQGDNPKFIHWKVSAKARRLMVKELQDSESKGAVVEFNPSDNGSGLEHYISQVASVFMELINRGYEVEFIAPDVNFKSGQIGRSPRPVLRYLALYGSF